jgi:signal transduction histidine kinase
LAGVRNRLSLRWKLASVFAMMAALAVAAFGILAYRAARTSAIEASKARLRSAITQIKTITDLGVVTQLDFLRTAAADPGIAAALAAPDQPIPASATTVMRRLAGGPSQSVHVELLHLDGSIRHAVPAVAPDLEGPAFEQAPDATIGPIVRHNGVLYFQSGAPVMSGGKTVGALRVTRRLGAASANRRIATNLLGHEVEFLVGNRGGTLYNDAGPVPSVPEPSEPAIVYRDGGGWVTASEAVSGTPWIYAVEIPERVALAPARALVIPFAATGAAIALVGALVGLRFSNRITRPLADLTAATEAIARGDRHVDLVATDRQDEIGRLARAFSVMTTSVRAVQNRLESEVDARTGELTHAVSRLRQLDGELRQNERFATLGRLSGSVSHELRNPLGVMSTVVFMLDAMPDASPKLKDYARLLREQIRLSERIISDLLDRARTGAPVLSTVDVPALLDDVLSHANIPESITVEREYATPLPAVVIDRDQVRQIVWNLVTNAVQAMEDTPEASGTLTVGAALTGGHLRIEVRDSGPGIAPSDADRVFEPMFTTKAQGVGLGLSISRAYARANGGDLSVADTGGPGACFVLDLPVTS